MTNAKCAICGKDYYVCMSCKDRIRLKPWTIYTDTPDCYKIFQIIHGFSTGVYSKEEAKEKLKNIDLTNFETLKDDIKKVIEDILFEEVKDVTEVQEVENQKPVETQKPKKKKKK